jgi:flavin reductase (DIM6/NTAB) family NADH-FMN oxidoreductase RutF
MSEADRQKPLASALGRIPSGLFILTARHGAAESGMLASWVQQCAFQPPLLSAALRGDRTVAGWLTEGSVFVLNILEENQTDLIAHFGRGFGPNEPAFTDLEVERSPAGLPVLTEALAFLECRLVARHAAGDHELFIAQVIDGRLLNEGHPMVHVRKNGFHY